MTTIDHDVTANGEHHVPLIADPLAEALHFLRMDGMFYCRSELSAPWGVFLPEMPDCLWFHVITEGECTLIDAGGVEHRVAAGDVVVLPHGGGHRIVDVPGSPAPLVFDVPHDYVSRQYAVMRHGGGGEPAKILCGVVQLGSPVSRTLIQHLPGLIRVDAAMGTGQWEWLPGLMALMAQETQAAKPGGETVVTRLCDILVIQAIRWWIENDAGAHRGWIGALRDPMIGPAIGLIHHAPERDWTVASLAAEVAMSRSAFSARFSELVGTSPKQYITQWRMQLAQQLLRDEPLTILEVATRLGYQSEAAFSRAFKREVGVAPSKARTRT